MRNSTAISRAGRIIGSVNPLVPKPGTTYQWLPMENPHVVEQKIKRLRSLTADLDNVYFNIKSERHSYYQALLSLGDRRVAPVIEIPVAGHHIMLDQPVALVAALRTLLADWDHSIPHG